MADFAVILPAAGRSSRFGGDGPKKVFTELAGRAVWLRAAAPFLARSDVAQVILAIAPEDRAMFERQFGAEAAAARVQVIDGGAERHETIALALEQVGPSCAFVAVHDAARPCVTPELIDAVFRAAREHGAAVPGLPVTDTVKRIDAARRIIHTVPRADLVAVQTPQAFRRDWLAAAYARRAELGPAITDDAQLLEALGHPCIVVEGSRRNLKITVADDLRIAAALLEDHAEA